MRHTRPCSRVHSDFRAVRSRVASAWGWTRFILLAISAAPFLFCLAVCAPACAQDLAGEFGADLRGLIRFYIPPRVTGESNHYFDLWDGGKLRSVVQSSGLTNNHALFINSHGTAHRVGKVKRYAYYPHERLAPMAHFSAGDIATVVGTASSQIHNIVIAGCDTEGAFDAAELKRLFPNATNITHTAAGQPGYQPMFLQAILSPAEAIDLIYEVEQRSITGEKAYKLTTEPHPGANKLHPYIAELYTPSSTKPFRTQIAGRELLQAPNPSVSIVGKVETTRRVY